VLIQLGKLGNLPKFCCQPTPIIHSLQGRTLGSVPMCQSITFLATDRLAMK
jgi:hypothetical protein